MDPNEYNHKKKQKETAIGENNKSLYLEQSLEENNSREIGIF